MKKPHLVRILLASSLLISSCTKKKSSVEFIHPKEGSKVGVHFPVEFKAIGMKEKAAGDIVEGTGHHHLIIHGGPIAQGEVVPKDEAHIHFGGGEMSTQLTLAPGKHTLTLQFADGAHRSYGKEMSQTISITVE